MQWGEQREGIVKWGSEMMRGYQRWACDRGQEGREEQRDLRDESPPGATT